MTHIPCVRAEPLEGLNAVQLDLDRFSPSGVVGRWMDVSIHSRWADSLLAPGRGNIPHNPNRPVISSTALLWFIV